MKKLIMVLVSVCALIALVPAATAFASDTGAPPNPGSPRNEVAWGESNVTITVVIPGKESGTPAETPEPAPPENPGITMFPVDVTEVRDGGNWQIIRTYELLPFESPLDIPQGSFERSGWSFTITEIVRKESANAETREHTETVTLDSATNELAQILPMLGNTMEYRDEDGFVGILALDVSSIKVETAGTRTTSHTTTVTREYPNLSTNDSSLVPKTVTDRGTTYTLANVDWRVGNYSTVDYERIPDYYTAIANYTATGSRTTVTGYAVTAEYVGSLARLSQGKTTYVAYFLGEEIRTPLEMVAPTPAPTAEPFEPLVETPVEAAPVDGHVCEPVCSPDCTTEAEPTDSPDEPDEGETKGADIPNAALFAIIPCAALLAGGAFYFIKKRKGATTP